MVDSPTMDSSAIAQHRTRVSHTAASMLISRMGSENTRYGTYRSTPTQRSCTYATNGLAPSWCICGCMQCDIITMLQTACHSQDQTCPGSNCSQVPPWHPNYAISILLGALLTSSTTHYKQDRAC